jgi:hypothetical protein
MIEVPRAALTAARGPAARGDSEPERAMSRHAADMRPAPPGTGGAGMTERLRR